MSDANGQEFVTISEAAQRLGIAPRQVRRYAERLPPEDRDRTGSPSVLRVRFEAVAALRFKPGSSTNGAEGHQRDRDRDIVQVSPAQVLQVYERLLSEKDARIAALEQTVAIQQANIEDLRRLLPPAPAPSLGESEERAAMPRPLPTTAVQNTPTETVGADSAGGAVTESTNGDGIRARPKEAAQTARPGRNRGLLGWRVMWRWLRWKG